MIVGLTHYYQQFLFSIFEYFYLFIVALILYSHSKTMIGGGAMCERQNCERGGAVIAAPPRIRGAPGCRSCYAPLLADREA